MNKKNSVDVANVCGIYKITSPSNRVYIGQSTKIRERYLSYLRMECSGQKRLHKSFIKYGMTNHSFEIIEVCNVELLNERERFWQDKYFVLGKNGLNCRLTESKDRSGSVSAESINKRNLTRAIKRSACKKIYQYNKQCILVGIYASSKEASTILGVSRSSILSSVNKNIRLRTCKGFVFSYHELSKDEIDFLFRKKDGRNRRKKIIQYNIYMKELHRYDSIDEAAITLNISNSSICRNLKGFSKTSHNTIFKYDSVSKEGELYSGGTDNEFEDVFYEE